MTALPAESSTPRRRSRPSRSKTHVSVVRSVDLSHARHFVDRFFADCQNGGAWGEAIEVAGVRTWPSAPDGYMGSERTPAQEECCRLDDEIVAAIEKDLREPLAKLFVKATSEVFARYRRSESSLRKARR